MSSWDTISRFALETASAAASLGFEVARTSTRVGFTVTRGIASVVTGATGAVIDHAFFGGEPLMSDVLTPAVRNSIDLLEQMVMAPIQIGQYITSGSLLAAHSSISVLSLIIPGSSEASFSLVSFIDLVKREWHEPAFDHTLPERYRKFGVTELARALISWVALQGVTQEWQERKWLKVMKEIKVEQHSQPPQNHVRVGSRIRVISDVTFPGNRGQLLEADIGEAPPRSVTLKVPDRIQQATSKRQPINALTPYHRSLSSSDVKSNLRRLSKLVLAGYGGASLWFFGVSPMSLDTSGKSKNLSPESAQKRSEEAELTHAISASEAEAAGEESDSSAIPEPTYSWWDLLLGRHDHEIFERYANAPATIRDPKQPKWKAKSSNTQANKSTAVVGAENQMPRYWVLTDHGREEIVLVLRGTMSLNELAVDLTCEPEYFEPASSAYDRSDDPPIPGTFPFPCSSSSSSLKNGSKRSRRVSTSSNGSPMYQVHGGMLKMARLMGAIGKPVHVAVMEALYRNPGYDLVLSGHSLGAGVACLLGMMWADPKTCLTVRSSGLPLNRRVSVYAFAPPCIADPELCTMTSSLITSLVCSHDIVSRLSLGSVRDIRNAAYWLCEADTPSGDSKMPSFAEVTKRASAWKSGAGSPGDEDWFVAVRKTLEANMTNAELFPPGRVLWAIRDTDLHPAHRIIPDSSTSDSTKSKLRLFDVLDVVAVFGQIVFARDMLSSHMPVQYDRMLHEML